jgi:CBS domain-containing protein
MWSRPGTQTILANDSEEATAMTTTYTRTHSAPARSLADVRVAEAMHQGVIKCAHDAPLSVVARVMAAHRIHCVVVPTAHEPETWGIVSDLDLIDAVYAGELADRTAGETAASSTLTVHPGDTLERAAQLMHEYRESHVVVIDQASTGAIGVISTLDVADALAEIAAPWPCRPLLASA